MTTKSHFQSLNRSMKKTKSKEKKESNSGKMVDGRRPSRIGADLDDVIKVKKLNIKNKVQEKLKDLYFQ